MRILPSLGWEGPLEEGMATHSNSLTWRIPWMEEPGGLQSMGSQRVLCKIISQKCFAMNSINLSYDD